MSWHGPGSHESKPASGEYQRDTETGSRIGKGAVGVFKENAEALQIAVAWIEQITDRSRRSNGSYLLGLINRTYVLLRSKQGTRLSV